MWIHLWGWLTRSRPSGFDQGWLVDDQTLVLAPLVGVELHWGPSLWSGHGASIGLIVAGVRAVYHSMASPLGRKSHACGQCRFPTQFFIKVESGLLLGAFLAMVEALLCHALLLDF